ncbi:MAG TPA: MEDS domain-containing protein [Streptosporangiaceae bacterium]|nr:MEDS domain-containing protein [Streptosporangiaceae bacterium]
MRHNGTQVELIGMALHDHIGWVFSGPDQFAALARKFLAEGTVTGERLLYVAEDPGPEGPGGLDHLIDAGILQVASIREIYGSSGIVDAARQRATFAQALAQAQAEGYTGIRVAADNTPLLTDERRFQAWMRWEVVADRFMSENAVIGLCAFDRQRVDIDRLRHTATLHPLLSSTSPVPQFRLFADDRSLYAEGDLDTFAVQRIAWALPHLPCGTGVVIDLEVTTFLSNAAVLALRRMAQSGIEVTVRGATEATGPLSDIVSAPRPTSGV